jgi:hypothetical protein
MARLIQLALRKIHFVHFEAVRGTSTARIVAHHFA